MILCVFLFVPFTFAYTDANVIPISEQKDKTDTLELGETKIIQTGVKGDKVTKYKRTGTIVDFLFNVSSTKKHDVSETYGTQPKKEIISIGTRRYQYMMCSNGASRYYTDEQMKNENIGFTSKSEDYCAKNNDGVKTKLADDIRGNMQATSNVDTQTRIDPSCHKENITNFSTVYEDRSYLPLGTQQIGITGRDGFTLVCPSIPGSQQRTDFPVANQIVYVGTGKTSQQIAEEQAQAEAVRQTQLLAEKQQSQRLKQTQCIQSLRAQGMSADSAQYECLRLYPAP